MSRWSFVAATVLATALAASAEARASSILLITNESGNTVEKYDAVTYAPLGSFATGLDTPEGIAIGRRLPPARQAASSSRRPAACSSVSLTDSGPRSRPVGC